MIDRRQCCCRHLVARVPPSSCADEFSWRIDVGSWVLVRESDGEESWCVVTDAPSDPLRRCVSKDSPLGLALLGHIAGDVVGVQGADGSWPITVVAVDPGVRSTAQS